MTEKKNFFKSKSFIITAASVAAVAAVLAVVLIIGAIASSLINTPRWGKGVSKDIPEFNAKAETVTVDKENGYVAAYYTNVTGEQVAEYISTIEQECGVSFNGDRYPRSAVYGDKIIVIHYNVTEMNFSVTVTEKAYDISNTSGETK